MTRINDAGLTTETDMANVGYIPGIRTNGTTDVKITPAVLSQLDNAYVYTAPAFASVSSLLHFDGTNGSTTITDQIAGNTWTAAGTAALATAQSVFGTASLLVPGSGNSGISMPTSSKYDVAAGEWTIEFRWKYSGAAQTSARIFQTRNGDVVAGIGINVDTAGVMTLYISTNGSSYNLVNGSIMGTLSTSNWNNVLVQRRSNGSTLLIETFIDGVLKSQITATAGSLYYNSGDSVIIGGNVSSTSRSMNAYIDEFRFTKGLALLAPRYTHPTTAFPNS